MKIVLLTVDHIYANKLVKDILLKFGKDVKLIVEPKVLLKSKNIYQTIFHYLKISGFYYFYYQVMKMLIYKVFNLISKDINSKFCSFNIIAKKLKIKRLKVSDINSSKIIKKIKMIKPDVVVSVLFPQIIKNELIRVAKNKIINFHPAYLPKYRGISPIFWSLLNNEKNVGYTIHFIDKGIDSGAILTQKKIKIIKNDTEDSLYMRCVREGSEALNRSIEKFANSRILKGKIRKGGSYYSFPDKKSVNKFLASGKRFYNIKQFIWN